MMVAYVSRLPCMELQTPSFVRHGHNMSLGYDALPPLRLLPARCSSSFPWARRPRRSMTCECASRAVL